MRQTVIDMATALSYAGPALRPPSRLVRWLAHLTLIYPFLALGALYGEWMLAWVWLGHQPRTWIDDPKDIAGGFAHLFTALVFLGLLPAILAGTVLNILWVIESRASGRAACLRLLLFWALWPALCFVLWRDPLALGRWWFD